LKRLLTVRSGYLYIVLGSALISGIFLFAVHRVFALLYSHYSSNPNALFVRLSHWLINHIGKTPLAVLIFLAVFTVVFMLRSQKIADDVKALLKAAGELANQGSYEKLEVSSGGELREIAACLERINQKVKRTSTQSILSEKVEEVPPILPGNEEIMALILRMKSLLRLLEDTGKGEDREESVVHTRMEVIKQEALGMERLMESLITPS
jgi:hypothetical protein